MRTKLQLIAPDDESFVEFEDFENDMKRNHAEVNKNNELVEPQFNYLGRLVNKKHFRAFVYSNQGQKLVESYDEYEKHVSTGTWFSSKEDLLASVNKPLRARKPKPKVEDLPDHEVIEYGTDR